MPAPSPTQRDRTLMQLWVTRKRAISTVIFIGVIIALIFLVRGWNKVPPAPGPAEGAPPDTVQGPR